MRVGVLHNLRAGGARRRLAEQIAHLAGVDGVEVVEVTTSTAEPVTPRPVVVPLGRVADRVAPPLRPSLRYHDLRQLRLAWRRMGALAEAAGVEVVYANPDRWLKGAAPCVPGGVPVVRYVDEPRRIDHEPETETSLNPRTRRLYTDLRRRERSCDGAGVAEAAVLLTNSRYTAGRIRRAYGRDAAVVPSGVCASMTASGPRVPEHLLSVGSLIRSKGHDTAIAAAAASGLGLPLVVVAHGGDPAEEQRLHRVAAGLGVRLTIRTGISDADLAAHYRGARALLYLAEREPLGLASLEAQACGCPVVAADEGGLPETVAPGAGEVVPRDAAAAGAALRRVTASGAHVPAVPGWDVSAAALRAHLRAAVGGVLDLDRAGREPGAVVLGDA